MSPVSAAREVFHFVMIKPSHYDDDGYPILAAVAHPVQHAGALYGLARGCRERQVLGPDVEIDIHADRRDQHARPSRPDHRATSSARGGRA